MQLFKQFKTYLLLLTLFFCIFSFWRSQKIERLVSFKKETFANKLALPPPAWQLGQIESDLTPFKKQSIDPADLLTLFLQDEKNALALFTIKNGKLFSKSKEDLATERAFQAVKKALEILLQCTKLPDTSFVVSLKNPSEVISTKTSIPVFVFAKNRYVSGPILMPDSDALSGHLELKRLVRQGWKKYPWKKKSTIAFWRGSAKGEQDAIETTKKTNRLRVALISHSNPKEVDAKFYNLDGLNEEMGKEIVNKELIDSFVPVKKQFKYKYLIDLDARSCTNKRCFGQLYSNCVPFKQESDSIQWYHGYLKPYIHYIPIKRDLSDLLEKIEWAKAHDAQMRQIGRNGIYFVEENLAYEDLLLYFYTLITKYTELLKPPFACN